MNLLLAGLALASSLQAEPPEMRGVWVVRTALATPESADAVVDDAARAGLNALFVQVRGRGDALYRSAIAPRSEVLRAQPPDFDPLARMLDHAVSEGFLGVEQRTNLVSSDDPQRLLEALARSLPQEPEELPARDLI